MPKPKWLVFPTANAWALLVFFSVEFFFFDQIGAHHHTWIFPRWNDQIQYLSESYTGYEQARTFGFLRGLWLSLVNLSAQGTLHDFLAILIFRVVGPSRSAALSLNLVGFVAWQLAIFRTISQKARVATLAWAALGLTLCLRTPWAAGPGSAVDFRLDWMAACTFGIALISAIRTERFFSVRWSAVFGFAVGYALLTRFLTGTYFLLIYLIFLGWTLGSNTARWRRAANLVLSAVVAAAMAGPVMWLNREWVYNYYFIGHFTGPESAIRSPHMGLGRSVQWLVNHFAFDHLGAAFLWVAGVASVLLLGVSILHRQKHRFWPNDAPLVSAGLVPAFAFLFSPAFILALHQQKSECVLSIMLGGALTVILLFWCNAATALSPRLSRILAVVTLLFGSVYFIKQMVVDPISPGFQTDARKVLALADLIYVRAKAVGLDHPRVGVDRVTDCLDGQVLRVICYERKKTWVPFIMTLPTGIGEESESLLMERLAQSDFVFLTESEVEGGLPYDRQMRALRPQLSAWCKKHLKLVERFQIFGVQMVLYQRRDIL